MLNYLYDLAQVEEDHEKFVTTYAVPATQPVKDLAGHVALPANDER